MTKRADDNNVRGIAKPDPLHLYGPGVAMLVTGLLVSGLVFLALRTAEVADSQQQFSILSGERRDLLQKQVDSHLQVLAGVRALFDSSEFVSAQEFDLYTQQFIERFPHMHALEWIPRVTAEQRAAFEATASRELNIEYAIRERDSEGRIHVASQRSEYRPIYYSQARDGLVRVGMDTFVRPENAQAMQAAATHDQAAAARISLREFGVEPMDVAFVYLPIFDKSNGRLDGFVRTSIALGEMLQDAAGDASNLGMAIELLNPNASASDNASVLNSRREVSIADMQVALRFWATGAYKNAPRLLPIYALLVGGVIISVLGALATFLLTRRRLSLQSVTLALFDEVNERRLSEQRLSSSEARYRVLVENSPDAILLQLHGKIIFANAACVRMFKMQSADELIGKSVYDLTVPECHDLIRSRARILLEERAIPPLAEEAIICADGTHVAVEVMSVPFETEAGTMIQVIGRDITQRKADEAERKRLEAALRQSQKIEALGTLAGGIAHDFNNILSAIIGNTRLLLDDAPPSPQVAQTIREIMNAAHRARDLVKRIATFSQQQESQRVEVAVTPLVNEVQQLLRATVPAGIEITVRTPLETPWVLGDATQILQVLLNICTNAWQAIAGKGRIEIEVTTVDATLASEHTLTPLDETRHYVRIEIRDDGMGMARDLLDHIFEPFFTTKRAGQGSGLGLAVVYGIVQNHRGGIAVASEPGKGTTFFVYLPACAAPAKKIETQANAVASGAKQHILYVDDEEAIVYLIVRILTRDGYRCTGSHDAAQALQLVKATPHAFDMIVTDLNMPGMSGLELAREVKTVRPELPVIITTGYIRANDVAMAKQIGARAIVLKPDTIEEMGALVQSHLQ